jgi:hypothetical protein
MPVHALVLRSLPSCARPKHPHACTHARSALDALLLSHNQLPALPPRVLGMAALRELEVGGNLLDELAGPVHLMEGLQVMTHGRACTHGGVGCVYIACMGVVFMFM